MPNLSSLAEAPLDVSTPTPLGTIALVDYDMGNLHSVAKALENWGMQPEVTNQVDRLWAADGIILPGVGAFDPAMQHLRERDLVAPIQDIVASGKPFFGICLGMQILLEGSEEGKEAGLGIIPGQVRRFHSEPGLTIPHMGWNTLHITQPNCPLWRNTSADRQEPLWAYFVHSYYVDPQDPQKIAAQVTHGSQTVTAAIAHETIMATQFHPEKSSQDGLQILKNFVDLVAQSSDRS